jgi:hypothetical protein
MAPQYCVPSLKYEIKLAMQLLFSLPYLHKKEYS